MFDECLCFVFINFEYVGTEYLVGLLVSLDSAHHGVLTPLFQLFMVYEMLRSDRDYPPVQATYASARLHSAQVGIIYL